MTFFERIQANARAPPQLLGTLGGDVNEEEPALDCRRGIDRFEEAWSSRESDIYRRVSRETERARPRERARHDVRTDVSR